MERSEKNVNKLYKMEIADFEHYSMGAEDMDVDVRHIPKHATKRGRKIFEVFHVKGKR